MDGIHAGGPATLRPGADLARHLQFQGQWNDFLWPLVVLNDPTLFTLPLGIAGFNYEHIANTNWVLVGSIFTTLPMVFLVFFFQRYIIKSVATTGGK